MKKALIALAAVATIAAGALAAPTQAQARCHGCGVAAGVVGGLAAGAIIGGAIANSQPRYYGPPRGYVVYDDYYAEAPYGCTDGYWARRPVAFDRWGNPVRWSRPRYICP
ncbi:MAG: hypothetical protein AB7T86_04745 [Xanthobacteraceae bacterium]|uniref:hypothetical protein n=1 Tax=Pseudolabrys sp. TaxID=1960880 RepID=UPI003D1460F5